jgi:ABC-type branched-subunit amino acid transport system substrate-binding protein
VTGDFKDGEGEFRLTRRSLLAGGASASALLLASCGSGLTGIPGLDGGGASAPVAGGPTTGPTIGAGRVRVGLILPLSAPGQGGVVGNSMRNAAELALSEFQGADLTLLVKDDQGTADGGRAAAEQAFGEGAEMLIGPLFAPSVQAAGQAARAANRPVIGFSTDTTVAARGVYLLSFLPETEVSRVISYAAGQGRRGFGALIPETPYGKVAEAEFQQAVARSGGRVAVIDRYAANAESLRAAVGRLAAGFAQMDALFVPEQADALPLVIETLTGSGLDSQKVKLLGTGVWNDARVFRIARLQGGWFAAPDTAGFNAFAARYKTRFNADPTRNSTLAYDAVSLTAALVRTQGPNRFAEQVLTNPSGFAGADGVFRFRPDGLNDRGLAVLQVGNGVATTVSPAPREFPKV